ncbi:TonB-dependent receptor plug domain-containing protein [Microbulbifer thermotolerans]|uniref:TonB-dependent receptor n=1 Tax=Microbulbifer thermotolerans TaxID=252514 RepID=A0A143HL17_MICTH|nr:TonB-dependent receptor [Microbulbifer thermotolerans]AMX01952.1 TonB-dependent receptor [Microbulbifer thermotolerans]MCX2778222.1 TonB-dependent receptor [Microbulbifer thermotolerans]MCX2803563.1 TonB-dependent receptor [Microbulbifer thermotolerans]MCX2841432.1 TonB-dependent receptor [Microbulbifer thermotolerans]
MHNPYSFTPLSLAIATALTLPISPVFAQNEQSPSTGAGAIEEVVITGTRKEGVSPTETLSPVDLVGGANLTDQASFDLTESLSKIAPSFNTQRFPIADGTAFIRPVTLRNLSPDQTLVLVNGTRRHRSALVNLQVAPLGTINQGAQAVDFSALPSAAIERVEVLRDGASAQYGSDAIAGVVNVILKDDAEGFSVSAQTGEYFEGDGTRYSVSANAGFALGEQGFVNTTFEYSSADTTSRGGTHADAAQVGEVVGVDQVPLDGLGQRWGDPEVEISKLFVNTGYDISDSIELYGNFGYSENETISDFFYRTPVLDPQYGIAARATLQKDADGDFLPDPAPQSLIDDIVAAGMNPSDLLVADASSPSGYVLRNPIYTLFPGGYNPKFGANITDISAVFGARGEFASGMTWDLRARTAENELEYVLEGSINPSLGLLTPTSFNPGTLTQEETSVNADFVQPIDISALASPLNVAFGAEWRRETYKIGAGDEASRASSPTANYFGEGSDGFQGFPLEAAGSYDSDSVAVYVDLEADITDQFTAGAALRYEDYDQFGSTSDWKLSARYNFNERFALRATANTGFRAPTPGQVNTLNVTTTANSEGKLIPNGTYPVNHPVAQAFGSVPLVPEESTSFTLGAVITPFDNTSITIDYYNIDIENRLALRNITIGNGEGDDTDGVNELALLTAAGVANADQFLGGNVNYFVNAYDSEVSGIDLAITSDFELGGSLLTVDLRHNHNEQEVTRVEENTIDALRVYDLENQVPSDRTTLTFNYDTGELFSGYLRFNRYSDWESTGGLFGSEAATYSGEVLVDLEATFDLAENYRVSVGGENIFDVEADQEADPTLQYLGVRQSLTSPFGFNGGFWYLRVSANF